MFLTHLIDIFSNLTRKLSIEEKIIIDSKHIKDLTLICLSNLSIKIDKNFYLINKIFFNHFYFPYLISIIFSFSVWSSVSFLYDLYKNYSNMFCRYSFVLLSKKSSPNFTICLMLLRLLIYFL